MALHVALKIPERVGVELTHVALVDVLAVLVLHVVSELGNLARVEQTLVALFDGLLGLGSRLFASEIQCTPA